MTDQATRVVPAGWYQDPAASEQVRWWNGLGWTEHVRDKPTTQPAISATGGSAAGAGTSGASIHSSTEETAEERIAAARRLEREFGMGTAENEIIASTAAFDRTAQAQADPVDRARAQRADAGRRTTGRTATGSAWLIALTPVLAFALGIVAAYVYFYISPMPLVFAAAIAVPVLLGLLWAVGDRRALQSRGYDAPSAAWALLGSIGYLIARRVKVPGTGPIAMFLIVALVSFGSLPLAASLGQLRPLSNALKIQSTISNDYISHGKAVSVNCPPFVDATTPGTLYTCDSTQATGVHHLIWVSIDGPDGSFTYSLAL
ncbi:DUF2510 domain-containing protein [Lysinimonas soli]|uniref:DUF2510 domain-containing protein n=1 Tax=Lysinimonas soli TaxID=1074233 RepID=A0ABW0NMT0_9MICO